MFNREKEHKLLQKRIKHGLNLSWLCSDFYKMGKYIFICLLFHSVVWTSINQIFRIHIDTLKVSNVLIGPTKFKKFIFYVKCYIYFMFFFIFHPSLLYIFLPFVFRNKDLFQNFSYLFFKLWSWRFLQSSALLTTSLNW